MSDDATPWYRSFFERDYYDTFYAPLRSETGRLGPEQTAREVQFIVDALELAPGARVLDLACGHGRHSIELARLGYGVTGLDISAYHIELATAAAARAGVPVNFICADMRELPVEPPFDAVVNFFTAFGYLENDEEDAKVIRRVARSLKPGGRFLLEMNNAANTLGRLRPSSVTTLDDGTMLIDERAYDVVTGRFDGVWTYVGPSGERKTGELHVRAYTAPELVRIFEAAGLRLVATYGDLDRGPLTLESRRMTLVCEKAAPDRPT